MFSSTSLTSLNDTVGAYELTYLSFSPKSRKSPNEALGGAIFYLHLVAELYLNSHGTSTLQLTRVSAKNLIH